MTLTVEKLALQNPYIAICLKMGQARSGKDEISSEERVRAKILAIAWFVFKEQALFWALALDPKKFGKKALISASAGLVAGAILELAKPSTRSPVKDWELWFEREVALNSPYLNFRRFLEGNSALFQSFATLLPIEEISYLNAARVALLAHYFGKQMIHMGRSK